MKRTFLICYSTHIKKNILGALFKNIKRKRNITINEENITAQHISTRSRITLRLNAIRQYTNRLIYLLVSAMSHAVQLGVT